MRFSQLREPMSLETFKAEYMNKKPFALLRKDNPFTDLLTLEEIETKLNDGLSSIINARVLDSGRGRLPAGECYTLGHIQNKFALNKSKIFDRLKQNYSLVLYNLSETNRGVSALSRSLEE